MHDVRSLGSLAAILVRRRAPARRAPRPRRRRRRRRRAGAAGWCPQRRRRRPISAGQIQRWFDAYTVLQAQEALRLSEAQYGRFVTRLKALQEIRRRHQQRAQPDPRTLRS